MKKIFFIILCIILFPFERVNATSGCCSSHGGVDCNNIQANGRVVCNDGWTGSSCAYDSMVKCQGYSPASSNTPTYVYGCTDKNARNYNSKANKDNGSCAYYTYGCMNEDSINYNIKAEKDDGTCIKKVYGCMDKNALNFNNTANVEDNNCEYQEEKSDQNETENDTKSEDSDSKNIGSGIVGIGLLGTVGYFLIKKYKK